MNLVLRLFTGSVSSLCKGRKGVLIIEEDIQHLIFTCYMSFMSS